MNETMVYTVKEVAAILHSSPNYVYTLIRKGYLPVVRLGSIKILKQSLEKFLIEKLEEWQQKKRTNGMLDETIRMNFSRKKGAETLEKLFITAIKQQ